MGISDFLEKLYKSPKEIIFKDTMEVIEEHYDFEPVKFTNGGLVNEAGQNLGSCKLFAFAKLQGLDKAQTLACFGDYFRVDVLENPKGEDHQNIRNFMSTGWEALAFDRDPLTKK